MFEGFTDQHVVVGEVTLRVRPAGTGTAAGAAICLVGVVVIMYAPRAAT